MGELPWVHSQGPALPGGHGEEGEEGPQHVVVVEVVLLPLARLSRHAIFIVVQELTPERGETERERERVRENIEWISSKA